MGYSPTWSELAPNRLADLLHRLGNEGAGALATEARDPI
jgi:hypothetical protein